MKKLITLLLMLFTSTITFAQQSGKIEMADALLQSGKIYVVVAVLAVIFTGIIIYLISLDKKIGKLEKEIENK